jgi:multimeric flavodoxin WrbA
MRITILNGDPDPASAFNAYLCELTDHLALHGHMATRLDLAGLDLKGCSGCWSCWVNTPGECSKRDDSAAVCRAVLDADLLVLASPITMGFTTALLKRAADQMIPLLHPYFAVEQDEVHHRARYGHYPAFGLLLDASSDVDAEDVEITTTIWSRFARNMKSRLAFAAVAGLSIEEVADELARVA